MDEPRDAFTNYPQQVSVTVPWAEGEPDPNRPPYEPPVLDEGIDWGRIERLLWEDLKIDSFEVHCHAAEGATLYRVVLRSGVVAAEGLDWHLEDAVRIAKESLIR